MTKDHAEIDKLCAQAFKLSVIACIGVVLVGLIAVAGLYPKAASQVQGIIQTTAIAKENK